jgi:hypothetical protein
MRPLARGLAVVLYAVLSFAAGVQPALAQFLTFRNHSTLSPGANIGLYASGGNLYYADSVTNTIGRIDPVTGAVTVIAGNGYGAQDGPVSIASFRSPSGVAVDGSGNIYVADTGNHKIRRISAAGNVTTVAGSPSNFCGAADGTGSAASFCGPKALDFNVYGDLFVADSSNNRIRLVTTAGYVSTIAGGTSGSADGTGTAARFNFPTGIASNGSNGFYVADQNNCTIRLVTLSGTVTTVAGLAGSLGNRDGTGSAARFYYPTAVSVAPDTGEVFVSDYYNYAIRRVSPAGVVTTAGGIVRGPGPDEGTGYAAEFDGPRAVAAIDAYTMFAADNAGIVKKGTRSIADEAKIDAQSGNNGTPRQLSVTPLSATSFAWSVVTRPSGSVAALSDPAISNPTFTPDFEGQYKFRLDASSAAGTSITYAYLSATCAVKPAAPAITRLSGVEPSCPGALVELEGASGYDSYSWSYGGSMTPIATARTFSASPASSTTWYLTGTINGCTSDPRTYTHSVVGQPVANSSLVLTGTATVCANGEGTSEGTFALYPTSYDPPGYSRQWGYRTVSNGPITPIPGQTAYNYTINGLDFPGPGTYWIVCTITPTCGFSPVNTEQRSILLRPAVGANLTSSSPSACGSNQVTLTASGSGGGGGTFDIWIIQRGSPDTTIAVCSGVTTCNAAGYGGRTYYAVVWQGSTCSATTANLTVGTNPLPAPQVTSSYPSCQAAQMVVIDPNPTSTYVWSNGATGTSMVPATSGSYRVTETTAQGCSATSFYGSVTQNLPPDATITPGGPTTFCPGGSVTLTSTLASAYLWSNGATTRAITVTQGGSYSVEITYNGSCKKSSAPMVVTVETPPAAVITPSGPTTFCQGGSVTLSASPSAGASYLWSNGATTPSITVSAAGSYTVTVTSPSGCPNTSAPLTLTVTPYPVSGINFTRIYDDTGSGTVTRTGDDILACGNPTVRLIAVALNAGYSYSWSTGAHTAVIDVTTSGTYTLTVTAPGGCATVSSVNVTYGAIPPKPSITASGTELCPAGGSVTLTAPAADSWTWSNGATTQSIAVATPGSYTVRVRNGGCDSVVSDPVTVTTGISSIATADSLALCDASSSATLTANDGTSWLWSNGATTRSIVVTQPGPYSVTTTNNGCTMAESAPVMVTARSVAINAGGPLSFCEGLSVTLTASDGDSWLWSNGATTRAITVSASGTYGVTATFLDGCTVTPPPVAVEARRVTVSVAADRTSICAGDAIVLTASAGGGAGYTYQWYDNTYTAIAGATAPALTIHPSVSGFVYVKVLDELGCQATSGGTIYSVTPRPDATITTAAALCEGQNGSAGVADAGPGATYSWTIVNGTLLFPNLPSVTFTPSGTAPVTLTVTVTNGNCEVSSSKSVTIHPLPAAAITPSGPTTFCAGGSVTLSAPAAASCSWSNGATTQSIVVSSSGSYSVTVTSANGCRATSASTAVTVNPLPAATVSASGPTTFCAGGSVTLTAGAASSYLWSNGATTQSIVVSSSGSYSVIVTNGSGCSATSSATTVTVNALPAAIITAGGPTTFCAGGSVTLSAGAATSYLWSTGATTQSISATASGDYTVTTTSAAGCTATSAATTVTVTPLPVATIMASGPTTFCAGGSVTLTASSGTSYLWSNGATTQSIDVTSSGNYSVTVSANGCSATSTPVTVTVNALPAATITAGGPTTFCEGGSVTLTASSGASYLWSNGATTQSITATASGSYTVTVTNASGCSTASAPTTVTVNPLPAPVINASGPVAFCQGGSVTLSVSGGPGSIAWYRNGTLYATQATLNVTAGATFFVRMRTSAGCQTDSAPVTVTVNPNPSWNSSGGNGSVCWNGTAYWQINSTDPTLTYQWTVTNGTVVSGATTSRVTYAPAAGATSVGLDVVFANATCSTAAHFDIPVDRAPTPEITADGPTTFCAGGSVTLTMPAAPAGWLYLWSNFATTQSITVSSSGTYTARYYKSVTGCQTDASTPVTVNVSQAPSATITASGPVTFCSGGSVTLTAPAAASYLWSTGATTQAINVTAGGDYTVTTTSANGCSTTSAPRTVTVNQTPAATIAASGPTTFCAGGSVTLSASAGTSYLWSNGATTQSINVTASGNYSVTVGANGCSATSSSTAVTANPLPSATISASGPTTFCAGGSVTLTASSGSSYLWSTGATTQSIVVTSSGSYSVTVTNASGCSAASSATAVTVNALPSAAITASGPTTFCAGGSVTLTASAGASYLWSNGATAQSVNVTASGSYSVTVTNASGCSTTSSATSVTVTPVPAATIAASGPTTFCAGGSVTLTASSGSSYLWSNGATTPSIVATSTGSYNVTVTNASGCSTTSAATAVTVNAPPSAGITASGPTTFCTGGSVTLTASAGASYLWSNGATTASINVTSSGSYSVTVTNASGCTATSSATTVTVNALPSATITSSGPTTFCAGGSVTLTASAGASYLWSNGATTQAINATTSGNYSVTVTSAGGCSATSAATTVTVNPKPTPTITPSGPTTFCTGGSVTLTASAGSSYLWSTGAITASINVTTSGSYTVTTTNASGCSATSSATTVTVNANPTPTIGASGPTTFCAGGSVTLTASAGSSYLWSTGATTPSIVVTSAGSYSVTVTTAGGCSATSSATNVVVNAKPATPTITAGGPTTFCAGGSVTLTAPAGFTYSWSTGATTQSIVVSTSGSYTVTVTNAGGCSTGSAATSVTVNAATSISQQPQNITISRNTATTLSVTAAGTGTLTYQWYKGTSPSTTTPVSGATARTYTTPKLAKGTYAYWVRVTGSCGVVNSSTATVSVP